MLNDILDKTNNRINRINRISLATKEDIIKLIKDNGDASIVLYLDMNDELCLEYTFQGTRQINMQLSWE